MDASDNALLTQVGPGTEMGTLLRRHWIPARLSTDIFGPGSPPVRVPLLGETFVAFRDEAGKVGVLDDACPHRGASLYMGRTDDGCITCIYHGWKMMIDGEIVDTPQIQADGFKERNRARSFPVVEAGGIVWVYLGPPDKIPPAPNYRFTQLPESHRVVLRSTFRGNWLQSLESSLDPSHLAILHADYSPMDPDESQFGNLVRPDGATSSADMAPRDSTAPRIEAVPTDYGVQFAGVRQIGDTDRANARVSVYQAPFLVCVPPNFVVLYTPLDDSHTAQVVVVFDEDNPLNPDSILSMSGFSTPGVMVDGEIQANVENRFLQDRESMPESWSGIDGLLLEDLALIAGMEPIVDRTKENLVASDIAMVRARRMLIKGARDLENGIEPFHLGDDTSKLVAWEGVVNGDSTWQEEIDARIGLAADVPVSSEAP